MAIICTTEESKFSMYLFFNADTIANRIITGILDKMPDGLGADEDEDKADKAFKDLVYEEILKSQAQDYAERKGLGSAAVPKIFNELVRIQEEEQREKEQHQGFGVVKKDGTIAPIKQVNKKEGSLRPVPTMGDMGGSPEYLMARSLILQLVLDGYFVKCVNMNEERRQRTAARMKDTLKEIADEINESLKQQPKKPVRKEEKKRKLRIKKIKRKRPTQ